MGVLHNIFHSWYVGSYYYFVYAWITGFKLCTLSPPIFYYASHAVHSTKLTMASNIELTFDIEVVVGNNFCQRMRVSIEFFDCAKRWDFFRRERFKFFYFSLWFCLIQKASLRFKAHFSNDWKNFAGFCTLHALRKSWL